VKLLVAEIQYGNLTKICYYDCDISNPEALAETWSRIIKDFKDVHILVNNAARTLGKRLKDTEPEVYVKTMDINFHSIVRLNHLWLNHTSQKHGNSFEGFQLVHINSIGGTVTSS
jgi:short-subunit dehydrogenase